MENKDNEAISEKKLQEIDDTPEISIIVNVNDCKETLFYCIKSIKKQTFQNFEVFLVDNGSDDDSGKIAEDISNEDERFIYIKKSNDVIGDCRNVAIQKAKGKYISFIDGNDRVKHDFLENLYDAVNDTESDIAVCGYCYYFPKKRRKKGKIKPTIFQPTDNKIFTRGQALYLLFPDRPMRFFLWNKLWKKTLFTEHQITIPKMYYEDVITCTRLFYYAEKVITLEDGSYLYTRPDRQYDKKYVTLKHINDYIKTVAMIRQFLDEKKCYDIFKKTFLVHVRHVLHSLPFLILRVSRKSQNGFSANLKNAKAKVKFYLTCTKEELKKININEEVVK